MSEPEKKRRFRQIHLSTAVLLSLVTGIMLWANFEEWHGFEAEGKLGWPVKAELMDMKERQYFGKKGDVESKRYGFAVRFFDSDSLESCGPASTQAILRCYLPDFLIAFGFIGLTFISFEWLISREGRKK